MESVQGLLRHYTIILVTLVVYIIHVSYANAFHAQSREIQNAFSFPANNADRKKVTTKFTLTVAITSTVIVFPTVASANSIEHGELLFTQNCASCHRNGENVMNPKRDLKKETLLNYFGGGGSSLDEAQIVGWIEKSGQHQRLFFPNVKDGKLSHDDYTDAISFIVDQAKNDNW